MWAAISSSVSCSRKPTARSPKLIGGHHKPFWILLWRVERDKPILSRTAGLRSIFNDIALIILLISLTDGFHLHC